MTAATPGPWHAVAYEHGFEGQPISNFTVYTDATYPEGSVNNLTVCSGYGGLSEGFPSREQGMANAYLIAAAPRLYAALDDLLSHHESGSGNAKMLRHLMEEGRKAMAKAEGIEQ